MINNFRGKNYFLSNFYNAPVTYDGCNYLNNEAAFQSAKLKDKGLRNCFSNLQPNDAKKLGRKIELREDWESIKFGVMREVIRCKFNQNPDLVKKLIGTGNEELIEGNTWHDNTYGNCSCEKCKNIVGKNVLGKILMEERTRFKKGRV